MPHVVGRAKKIQKRHILGGEKKYLPNNDDVDINYLKSQSKTSNLRDKRKLILPCRYSAVRYKTGTLTAPTYNPEFSQNSNNIVKFGTPHISSTDLYHYHKDYKKFYVTKEGTYLVSVYLKTSFAQPATIQTDDIKILLYKNGSLWSELDYKETSTTIGGSTAYQSIISVQGTDFVYLEAGDYIQITYVFSAALDMSSGDEVEGYLDISYITNKTEKL